MKVTGPGPGAAPPAEPNAAEAGATGEAAGQSFADRMERTAGAGVGATPGAAGSTRSEAAALSNDLGKDLEAGRLSAGEALERVIGRILDRQVGTAATPAVRAQVEAALRDALASDPVLAAKLKALGE